MDFCKNSKGYKMKLLIEYTTFPVGLLHKATDLVNLDKVLIGSERQKLLIGTNEFGEPIYEITPSITLTKETVLDLKDFLSTNEKGLLRCSINFLRMLFSDESEKYFTNDEIEKLRGISKYSKTSFDQYFISNHFDVSKNMLNQEFAVLRNLILDGKFTKNVFLKPTGDLKDFKASVIHKDQDVNLWFEENKSHKRFLSEIMDDVVIASPVINNPITEYRNIIYKGMVLSTSQYCVNGKLVKRAVGKDDFDAEVIEKSNYFASLYQPSELFVMDVASIETESGLDYKIIEYNCFSCSGLYSCDFLSIFKEIEGDTNVSS